MKLHDVFEVNHLFGNENMTLETFSVKKQRVHISVFGGRAIYNDLTLHCNMKAGIDSTEIKEQGCVPRKLYLQRQKQI
jgi:hypothetical protein